MSISEIVEKPISGEWGSKIDSEKEGIPVIRNTNFSDDGRINLQNVAFRSIPERKIKRKKLQPGDIIIEKSGGSENQPVGRVVYFDIDDNRNYLFSNFTSAIRPKEQVVSKYVHYGLLYYYLRGASELFQNKTTGIRNLQLARYLDKLKIPLPSLSEQNAIVAKLDRAQRLIDIDRQMLAKYDELIQSVFLEMFGDPVRNEKGWEVKKLGQLTTKVGSGSTPRGGSKIYKNYGITFIRSQNVLMNWLDLNDVAYISEKIHESMKSTWVQENDVLLNITGASIGRVCVYNRTEPANVNQHVCILRINQKVIVANYLSYLISSKNYQNLILSQQSGGTRQAFNMAQIKKFDIPLPPIHIQIQFDELLTIIEREIVKIGIDLKKSQDLFSSLLQEAFE